MAAPVLRLIEADMLAAAERGRTVHTVGPFRAFLDPVSADPGQSFAIPVRPLDRADWRPGIHALSAVFRERGRMPRLEFLDRLWPTLGERLLMAGWSTEARSIVMTRARAPLTGPRLKPRSVGIRLIGTDGTSADIEAFLELTRTAFGIDADLRMPSEIARMTADLARGRLIVALAETKDGMAAGGSLQIGQRLVELADIGTLPQYRRRGLARALCAALLGHPHARAADHVWLTTGSNRALELYERRLGFVPACLQVSYRVAR